MVSLFVVLLFVFLFLLFGLGRVEMGWVSFGDGSEKSSDGAYVVCCVLLFVLGLGWDGLGWASFLRAPIACFGRVPGGAFDVSRPTSENYRKHLKH